MIASKLYAVLDCEVEEVPFERPRGPSRKRANRRHPTLLFHNNLEVQCSIVPSMDSGCVSLVYWAHCGFQWDGEKEKRSK